MKTYEKTVAKGFIDGYIDNTRVLIEQKGMGENYNLSKSEDYEPRQVTPEKREAIIDALKHFNMIE